MARRDIPMVFAVIIYISIFIVLTVMTDSSPAMVFLGTSPVLLFIITGNYLRKLKHSQLIVLWILPAFYPSVFYALYRSGQFVILRLMDGSTLTVFNILVCYILNVILLIDSASSKKSSSDPEKDDRYRKTAKKLHDQNAGLHESNNLLKKDNIGLMRDNSRLAKENRMYKQKINALRQDLNLVQSELMISSKNFSTTLKSIEDKCKAINFVIGRVYSNKRGGNPDLRNRLKIDRDLYNEFSEISSDFNSSKASSLIVVLQRILDQLKLLEKEESAVFTPKFGRILVKREKGDRILDVLMKNDKDPVADYHSEAKEICLKLIEFLRAEYK